MPQSINISNSIFNISTVIKHLKNKCDASVKQTLLLDILIHVPKDKKGH